MNKLTNAHLVALILISEIGTCGLASWSVLRVNGQIRSDMEVQRKESVVHDQLNALRMNEMHKRIEAAEKATKANVAHIRGLQIDLEKATARPGQLTVRNEDATEHAAWMERQQKVLVDSLKQFYPPPPGHTKKSEAPQ